MSELIIDVVTPLGFVVRCSRDYWERIILDKHPVLRHREDHVRAALSGPDEVRRSTRDPGVLLFYRGAKPRWMCAVARQDGRDGFLITAYPTDAIKNRGDRMDAIKVIHDVAGHTLTIWLDDPAKEADCEETTDEVVLMKDARGNVIGLEILNYRPATKDTRVSVETIATSTGS